MTRARLPAALALAAWLVVGCTAAPRADGPTTSAASAPVVTEVPVGTAPEPEGLVVEQTYARSISEEHWEDGVSLIDGAYDWGVLIRNHSKRTAHDVRVDLTFTAHGTEVETVFARVIEAIPPGELAWTTRPLRTDHPSAEVDGVKVTLTPDSWRDTLTTERDRLEPPDRVPRDEWKASLRIEPADLPGTLLAFVAHFTAEDRLVGVTMDDVFVPDARRSGTEPVSVERMAPSDQGDTAYVRAFLARVIDSEGLVLPPPQVTKAEVDAAAARWRANAPARYLWRFRRDCFCNGATLDVDVDGTRVTAVRVVDPGRQDEYSQEAAEMDARSIDELFAAMDKTFVAGDGVYADFDPELGYPRRVVLTSRLPDGGDSYDTIDLRPAG